MTMILTAEKLTELRNRPNKAINPSAPSANEAVCHACPDRPGCPIWRLTPCARAKAFRGDLAYPCPKRRFQRNSPTAIPAKGEI